MRIGQPNIAFPISLSGRIMKIQGLTDCGNGFEANLLQGRLASNGIRSLIKNEIMCGYPPMSGCVLFVDDGDLLKAQRIIGITEAEA